MSDKARRTLMDTSDAIMVLVTANGGSESFHRNPPAVWIANAISRSWRRELQRA